MTDAQKIAETPTSESDIQLQISRAPAPTAEPRSLAGVWAAIIGIAALMTMTALLLASGLARTTLALDALKQQTHAGIAAIHEGTAKQISAISEEAKQGQKAALNDANSYAETLATELQDKFETRVSALQRRVGSLETAQKRLAKLSAEEHTKLSAQYAAFQAEYEKRLAKADADSKVQHWIVKRTR